MTMESVSAQLFHNFVFDLKGMEKLRISEKDFGEFCLKTVGFGNITKNAAKHSQYARMLTGSQYFI
jgi:hypothetical protein